MVASQDADWREFICIIFSLCKMSLYLPTDHKLQYFLDFLICKKNKFSLSIFANAADTWLLGPCYLKEFFVWFLHLLLYLKTLHNRLFLQCWFFYIGAETPFEGLRRDIRSVQKLRFGNLQSGGDTAFHMDAIIVVWSSTAWYVLQPLSHRAITVKSRLWWRHAMRNRTSTPNACESCAVCSRHWLEHRGSTG